MTDFRIADAARFDGKEVMLEGWLFNKRGSGKLLFPQFRDGSGIMQGVVSKSEVSDETWERAQALTQESSVRVTGTVHADQRAPGGYELIVKDIEVVQLVPADTPYPISPKEHGTDFLLSHRHLWVRSAKQAALLRIRHQVVRAIHDFFDSNGFILTESPIITPAACEGTSTLFKLDYFDLGEAYLTQSGQLYVEATAAALGKVYTFGPTFRAEKSKTRRHLTEFWMVEPEMAYATLADLMVLSENLVSSIVERVLEKRRADLEVLERDVSKLEAIQPPFPRLPYDDAIKMIQAQGNKTAWGEDLGAPDETIISEKHEKPVIVHRYPAKVKAFYMEPDPERPELALCMDMLAPEGYGEIIGGSQRIADYDLLLERIREQDLPEEEFQWYLDLRRFGSVPHGGFGLGVERTVAWIAGIKHIRETIPFPRMIYRVYP